MAIVFAGANLVSPLWPIYRTELHLTALALTVIFAAYALGALGALFFLGGLSDVVGRRPILIASVVATIIASLLFAFARDITWLLLARFVQGLAVGGTSASANAALNDFAGPGRSRRASVTGSVATSVGFASGPFLAGLLADIAPRPTQTSFFVLIAVAVVALAALIAVPNSGRVAGAVYRGNLASVPASVRAPFVRAAASFAVGWVGGAMFLSLGPSIIIGLLHTTSHAVAGTMILAFFAASSIAQLLFRRTSSVLMLRCCDVGSGAGLLLAAASGFTHSLALFLIAMVFVGGAQGIGLLGGLALVNATTPDAHRGGVLGAFFLCGYFPVIVILPATGWIADANGLFPALLFFALVTVVAAGAALVDLFAWKGPALAAAD